MMGKYVLYVVLSGYIIITGCSKNDSCPYKDYDIVAPPSEEQAVAAYLTANNITATKYKSNMYYEILTPGSGGSPDVCSRITVNYSGMLTNGTEFDKGNNYMGDLGSLIEGWKDGLPRIQKGGRIKLYIPPSLGYGSSDIKDGNGALIIPGNSVLIFDVTLVSF